MDLLNPLFVFPLLSALLWLGIGVWPFLRYRYFSPFARSLTLFALLIGVWCALDTYFLTLDASTQGDLVLLVSEVRVTVITIAVLALALASKWIYFGHSRWDFLLALPVAASLVLVWSRLTLGAVQESWGPRVLRDPALYGWWAAQQVAYVTLSIVLTLALYRDRKDMGRRVRSRILYTTGSLFVLLGFWLATNIYNNVTQTAGVPWFSSLLSIPAAIIIVALVPLSPDELGELYRAVSALEKRVFAAYLFYRTGEPLVALSATATYPIEAEQLEGVLSIVGNFVETSVPSSRTYDVTSMRYEQMGILAVRGKRVIAAVVYDGRAYDAIRSELVRIVQNLEEERAKDLETWEDATRVAETVADELSALLSQPTKKEALPGARAVRGTGPADKR